MVGSWEGPAPPPSPLSPDMSSLTPPPVGGGEAVQLFQLEQRRHNGFLDSLKEPVTGHIYPLASPDWSPP
eukprot:1180355-Prorocentrum_minimum.AAC.1